MNNLPKKFEMCTKYNLATKYIMERSVHGMYKVTHEDGVQVERLSHNTAKFVQEAIDCGNWIVTKDLSQATGPELVFPFTAQHQETPEDTEIFVVTKGSDKGRVTLMYPNDNNVFYNNCFTENEAKQYIKDGIWIVKHVGEKIREPALVSNGSIATSKIFVNDLSSIGSIGVLRTGTLPEAPQSAPLSSLSVDIECDTDAAVEAVERLTQALEDLAISYESVIALQREFKEGV